MYRLVYILLGFLLLTGCTRQQASDTPEYPGVNIHLVTESHLTRIVDADNLAQEQIVNNVSVFFTDGAGLAFTDVFIHPPISTVGDTTKITLPLESAGLGIKDIYVVTNHDDAALLESLTNVAELRAARTPTVGSGNNLDPVTGICMYGMLDDFDFSIAGTEKPVVQVERSCAKYRFTLTFPDAPEVSAQGSILLRDAASFTFIGGIRAGNTGVGSYYDFADPIPLPYDGTPEGSTAIAYLYEAFTPPVMNLTVTIDGADQIFTANLPYPERNYLYDIYIEIFLTPITNARNSPQLQLTAQKTALFSE